MHMVKAGRCGYHWTAQLGGLRAGRLHESQQRATTGATCVEHSLSLSPEVLPELGSAELPCLQRDTDLPLTPWNVCLEACPVQVNSAA